MAHSLSTLFTRPVMIGLLLAGTTLGLTAQASGGWDWEEDFDHWRPASLQWAQDIDPQHPPLSEIEDHVAPPPDEPWCHAPGEPDAQDCDFHDDLLDEWLHDYLDIPKQDPLPDDLIPYPYECASLCSD